jgi:parallel beta-helix repeat protein
MSLFLCRRGHVASLQLIRKSKIATQLLLMAATLIVFSSLSFSATVAVGNCTNLAFYPTITQAVNSVPQNSTIKICPGTYAEQVLITKNLSLVGVAGNGQTGAAATGANNPTIVSPAGALQVNSYDLFDSFPTAAQIAVLTPSTAIAPIIVNVSNLTIDGSNNQLGDCGTDLVGIYYQNASGTINHVATRYQELSQSLFGCQDGLAIYAQAGYGATFNSTVTIENSSVHDYDKNGITADGDKLTATITGNDVVGIGSTPLIAQNGIQVSFGAGGKVMNNIVSDDVYVSPDNGPYYSASGILLYDSGGTSAKPITVSGNTVSNTQGGIVIVGDSSGTADYNTVSSNKITTTLAAGPYLIDGIDLCSNHNTATSNTVMNSAGAGVHIDSLCSESTGGTGNNSTATNNTVIEACAGVMTGTGSGNNISGTLTYNVAQVSQSGDSCPSGPSKSKKPGAKPKPQPLRR